MIPVYQKTKTDCVTAVISSLTGIPYEECPQLWEYTSIEWIGKLIEWARTKNLGLVYFELKNRENWPYIDNVFVGLVGSCSRSKEFDHTVVARAETENGVTKLYYEHDPYEFGDFIQNPSYFFFFTRNF